MPSENKTPLGLSQWVGRDRPKREHFNDDNLKIDLACRSALTGLTGHLESEGHTTAPMRRKWDEASAHTGEGIAGEQGLHGLRYHQGRLEVNVGGIWQLCAAGEQAGPAYKVYGVCIDTLNTDPEASVTYTDDAVGMTPCGPEWEDTFFARLRPCLLKNGKVRRYLNRESYLLDADGAAADILTGDEGDVMVEIPKLAYAIYTEGSRIYVKVTDHPDATALDSRFCYNAHTRAIQGDRQSLYVGAYLGSALGGRLRSLSEKQVEVYRTILDFRKLARANGDGYDLLGYYPYLLLQCLVLIRCKSRNTQQAMGRGYTYELDAKLATGGTDTKGMFFGEDTGLLQMKAFGLEDLWGNSYYFLDGVRSDAGGFLWTATQSFDSDDCWTNTGQGGGELARGYIGEVFGNNELGFLMKAGGGGAAARWCDYGFRRLGCVAFGGGEHYSRLQTGMFLTFISYETIDYNAVQGARLMYL